MPRSILDEAKIHPAARAKVAAHGAEILKEVQDAVAGNEIVVVGMRQNPFPKKARKLLDGAGLAYKYLEYGSYLGEWRRRLVLKMWTGWPTFPMVFVKGVLIGGASQLDEQIKSLDRENQAALEHVEKISSKRHTVASIRNSMAEFWALIEPLPRGDEASRWPGLRLWRRSHRARVSTRPRFDRSSRQRARRGSREPVRFASGARP